MKKPLMLLILSGLCMYYLQAQTLEASFESNFSANMAYVLENLDFSEVTSNMLYVVPSLLFE